MINYIVFNLVNLIPSLRLGTKCIRQWNDEIKNNLKSTRNLISFNIDSLR